MHAAAGDRYSNMRMQAIACMYMLACCLMRCFNTIIICHGKHPS